MGVEVKAFRKNMRNWLLGITGMSEQVGQRVFSNWPVQPPDFPYINFSLSREPATDYPGQAWSGALTISIKDPDEDKRDTVENLINENLANSSVNIRSLLTTAGSVACQGFRLASVPDDELEVDMRVEGGLAVGVRRMIFNIRVSPLGE